jgi:adenylate cyclase
LGHCFLGVVLLMSGRPKDAIESFEHGLRLSPFDPQSFTFFCFQALACYFANQPAKGLQAAHRALELRPRWMSALQAVVLCARALGDERQAAQALEEVKVASDTGDTLMFVLKFNPAWAEQVEKALAAPATA